MALNEGGRGSAGEWMGLEYRPNGAESTQPPINQPKIDRPIILVDLCNKKRFFFFETVNHKFGWLNSVNFLGGGGGVNRHRFLPI